MLLQQEFTVATEDQQRKCAMRHAPAGMALSAGLSGAVPLPRLIDRARSIFTSPLFRLPRSKTATADDSTLSPPRPNNLEARPGCRTSIDSYRNPLGLDSRLLGNLDLEHAIDVPCLDRLSPCRFRQAETAQEGTGGAFDVFEAVTF